MVRWFKFCGNQYIGFWALGLVLLFLQEIPYMVMPLFRLETNPIMNMREPSIVLNICEKVLGSLCIVVMTFIVHREATLFSINSGMELLFFCITIGILLLNYLGWALYFMGHQSIPVIMLFLVVLPPLYYIFIGLWRNNIPLTVTGCIFLIIHFIHVMGNLKLG